jgi:hypothetical protein
MPVVANLGRHANPVLSGRYEQVLFATVLGSVRVGFYCVWDGFNYAPRLVAARAETDPFSREVWDYNTELALEAAQHGFDEIQFDYVRFPDARGLVYSVPSTEENRCQAISGFLQEALVPAHRSSFAAG